MFASLSLSSELVKNSAQELKVSKKSNNSPLNWRREIYQLWWHFSTFMLTFNLIVAALVALFLAHAI